MSELTYDREAALRAIWAAKNNEEREDKSFASALRTGRFLDAAGSRDDMRERKYVPRNLEMLWYDDQGFYDGPETQYEVSDKDRAFAMSANGAWAALLRERTGEVQTEERYVKAERQTAQLLDMSKALAEKMSQAADPAAVRDLLDEAVTLARSAGACGESARKEFMPIARAIAPRFNPWREDTGWELRRYYVHSRQTEVLPNYRRIRFIPYVAQQLRATMVSALEFWLSKHPTARFWTFTSGVRVQLSGVTDRASWLHARLRKLNKMKFMREAGLEIVFRSTEMGTPETDSQGNVVNGGRIEYDETGQAYFHVHAHCVVEMKKGHIPAEEWSELMRRIHRFWGFRWSEDGAIRNAREVCKYVTKPAEMLKLSADQLVELADQLSGVRMCETSGSLRREIIERRDLKQRLVKRKTPDGRVYQVVDDWNKHQTRTRTEQTQDASEKLIQKEARGMMRVLARGTPRFGRSRVAEPCVTVMCMRGSWNEAELRNHRFVSTAIVITAGRYYEGVRRRLRGLMQARRAGSEINVHTRTPTVSKRPARPRGKPRTTALWPSEVGIKA